MTKIACSTGRIEKVAAYRQTNSLCEGHQQLNGRFSSSWLEVWVFVCTAKNFGLHCHRRFARTLVGIDHGTSSSRFVLFTKQGQIAASAQMETTQYFPSGEEKVNQTLQENNTVQAPRGRYVLFLCNRIAVQCRTRSLLSSLFSNFSLVPF